MRQRQVLGFLGVEDRVCEDELDDHDFRNDVGVSMQVTRRSVAAWARLR
jgi:hypothetical protein